MTKETTTRKRYLTRKMARQIRHLYFDKNARGALEYGERTVRDPTPDNPDNWKYSYDVNEWVPDESELYSPYDIRDGVGKIELYDGLCLDLYVYFPQSKWAIKREDWDLWENICVRFNGTDWEIAEYPKRWSEPATALGLDDDND